MFSAVEDMIKSRKNVQRKEEEEVAGSFVDHMLSHYTDESKV
jgi:hypothetical protein